MKIINDKYMIEFFHPEKNVWVINSSSNKFNYSINHTESNLFNALKYFYYEIKFCKDVLN